MSANQGIVATIIDQKIENNCINITYPQVTGLDNLEVQEHINLLIRKQVEFLIPRESCNIYAEIFGKYEVAVNKNDILSLNLQFYTIRKQAANGLNQQKSITVDLTTGKSYLLYELFRKNSNYRMVLDRMIRQQIEEQGLHLIKEFNGITDDQEYYLTENSLVIYFRELEYTIHAEGIPKFPIPYFRIRNLIDVDGPIGKLTQRSIARIHFHE
ncbi:DUF3298 and DUF4163 domain-containing protein [Desulfoscipio sp. XC116]|uniref:DUF3298 and DUF4163 domain-containing protein n=1 Tax=Desulfoscipio sp. XC116 TaxID=3144975 RepID=UPI00325B7D0F